MEEHNNLIEFYIKAKDQCWLNLFAFMFNNLGINIQNKSFNKDLLFNMEIKNLNITYTLHTNNDNFGQINQFIQNYALILQRKKPINDLFNEQIELIKFKQHLDLSALIMKITRDSEADFTTDHNEIFELHDIFAQTLLNVILLKS